MTQMMQKLVNRLFSLVVLMLLGLGGVAGYNFTKSRIAADVYRQRLESMSEQYETLRGTYNRAVQRTAVTELHVHDGKLDVRIRTADGQTETIPTPFDPANEIYVDYVVRDGRLWIRRVFDQYTPPGEGVVITPKLGAVDWNAAEVEVGKAVYRQLTEGRWVVTVTGDGSLGLAKRAPDDDEAPLSPPPKLGDYERIERQLRAEVNEVGATDVVKYWVGE